MPDDWEPAPIDQPSLPPRQSPGEAPVGISPTPQREPVVSSAPADAEDVRRKTPLVALALVSCVCAAGVIVFALSIVRNAATDSTTSSGPASIQPVESTEAPTTTTTTPPTTAAPTTVSTTLPPTTQSAVRQATLYSNFARVRSAPELTGSEVMTLENRDGAAIRVLGTHENGWYLIEVDGIRGWIFGAFVLPPDPDLMVAVTRTGGGAQLLTSAGSVSNRTNSSGSKVIITSETGDLFAVLLPEGDTAYVAKSAVLVVG